jgi:hypothetical protein
MPIIRFRRSIFGPVAWERSWGLRDDPNWSTLDEAIDLAGFPRERVEAKELAEDAQSVTFDALAGDDGPPLYLLAWRIVVHVEREPMYFLRPNGRAADLSSRFPWHEEPPPELSQAWPIAYVPDPRQPLCRCYGLALVDAREDGRRARGCAVQSGAYSATAHVGRLGSHSMDGTWHDTTTPLTSLELHSPEPGAIAAGSRLALFAILLPSSST